MDNTHIQNAIFKFILKIMAIGVGILIVMHHRIMMANHIT
jgi:hypothetical protein